MGGRLFVANAACDLMVGSPFVAVDLPYRHGVEGPLLEVLAERYSVLLTDEDEKRELSRIAGIINWSSNHDLSGNELRVLFASNTDRLSRNGDNGKTKTGEVVNRGPICKGRVFERILQAAIEVGDIETGGIELQVYPESEGHGKPNRAQPSSNVMRRFMAVKSQAHELARQHDSRYVNLGRRGTAAINREVVSKKGSKTDYAYKGFDNQHRRDLYQVQARIDQHNKTHDQPQFGYVWRDQFVPFATEELQVRAVFSGSIHKGGRMYASVQQLPCRSRLQLLVKIGDVVQPVSEEDFSSIHPTLAYAEKGQLPPNNSYSFLTCDGIDEELSTKICKRLVASRLNTETELEAMRATANQVQDEEISEADLAGRPYRKIKRYVFAMAPYVLAAHEVILQDASKERGAKLQRADSDIARDIMQQAALSSVPLLGIHDSFVVANGHADFLSSAMQQAFINRVGHGTGTKKTWLEGGVVRAARVMLDRAPTLPSQHVTALEVMEHGDAQEKKEARVLRANNRASEELAAKQLVIEPVATPAPVPVVEALQPGHKPVIEAKPVAQPAPAERTELPQDGRSGTRSFRDMAREVCAAPAPKVRQPVPTAPQPIPNIIEAWLGRKTVNVPPDKLQELWRVKQGMEQIAAEVPFLHAGQQSRALELSHRLNGLLARRDAVLSSL